MRAITAPVKNIRTLSDAVEELRGNLGTVPAIALVWGPTGAGKTTALGWLHSGQEGISIRACAAWTTHSLLSAIAHELSIETGGRSAPLLGRIVEALQARPGELLMVDEADYLLAGDLRMVETLRDIHDRAKTTPVLLAGMADVRRRIVSRPQLTGRISQWVEFRPADQEDARTLADSLCEVEVADDLLSELHQQAHGSVRGLVVGLSRIESFARRRGMEAVSAADWSGRAFVLPGAAQNGGRR